MSSASRNDGASVNRLRCNGEWLTGMPRTRGSSDSTMFTLAQGPSILMPSTSRRNSSPSSPGDSSPRKVRFGSAFETTTGASITEPSASVTPVTLPLTWLILETGQAVRIVTPESRQDEAIASLIAPMPPIT